MAEFRNGIAHAASAMPRAADFSMREPNVASELALTGDAGYW